MGKSSYLDVKKIHSGRKKKKIVAAERKLFVNSELALLTSTNSVHSVF